MADMCPPVSGVGPCDEQNQCFSFSFRPLNCDIDSVNICTETPLDVSVVNEVNIRPLDCLTDSVSVCIEEPLDVNVVNTGTISVEQKHPGVPGTIVPGSRWHVTGFNSLAGTLTIVSPIPAVNQRVICDWLDWSLVIASVGLGGAALRPRVYDGTAAGPIIWQIAIGLAGLVDIGTTYSGDSDGIVLQSSPGNQLTFELPSVLTLFDKSINFGGYIVEE